MDTSIDTSKKYNKNRKNILLIGFFIFVFTLSITFQLIPFRVRASVNLFTSGFEQNPKFSDWTFANAPQWDTTGSNTHSGSKKARIDNNDGANGDVIRQNQSTVGYQNVVLSYWYRIESGKSLESNDHVYVEWSIDGTNWNQIADYTNLNTNGNWTSASHNLPAGADNNSGFQFRFRTLVDGTNDRFELDDVVLDVDIIPTPTPTPSPTPTPTPTPSDTPSPTPSPSDTPTPTPTPESSGGGGGGGGGGSSIFSSFSSTPTPSQTPEIAGASTQAPQGEVLPETSSTALDKILFSLFNAFLMTGVMMLLISYQILPEKLLEILEK